MPQFRPAGWQQIKAGSLTQEVFLAPEGCSTRLAGAGGQQSSPIAQRYSQEPVQAWWRCHILAVVLVRHPAAGHLDLLISSNLTLGCCIAVV